MKTVRLSATGVTKIGQSHDRMVGGWIVQVSGTFSGTLKFRKKLEESSVSDANAVLFDVEDVADFASVDKATGVTAAGMFKAITDVSSLVLDYTHTSGECVVELEPFLG